MKKFITSAVVIVIFISSCKKDSFTSQQTRSANDVSTNASSSTGVIRYKGNYDIDLSDPKWMEFNSCTNELINIKQGIWHIEYTYITNGNKDMLQSHSNTSNYKLINLNTGIEYVGSYASNVTANLIHFDVPFEITQTLSVLLTTPGGGNNSMLKADFHLTIDANGKETAYVDNFRAGCQ